MAPRHPVLAAGACAALLSVSSCATPHGGSAPSKQVEVEEWPRPSAGPRFTFAGELTEARVAGGARGFWRTLVWMLTGSPDDEASAGKLVRPFDVEPDAEGGYLVADPDLPGVLRYGADLHLKAELKCKGTPWIAPISVSAGDAGAVYVADAGADTIVRWTPRACAVYQPPDMERPTGVAVAGDRLFVADPPNHRVLILTAAGGAPVARVGALGDGEGQFNYPTDVAAAPDGSAFVVDALNFRIVHLAGDGRWLGAFGSPGDEAGTLSRPKGVHVDRHGHVWVTDAQRDVVLLFDAEGRFLAAFGGTGDAPGRLAHPAGLSSRGSRLMVADSQNRRVQLFEARGELP